MSAVRRPWLGRRLVAASAAAGLVALSCATASPGLAANARPHASFGVFPDDPVAGQNVRFVSYGCDPDGRLAKQAWDLDGDGSFDDAFGSVASRAFQAGSRLIALRVTDDDGADAVGIRALTVTPGSAVYVLPRPFNPLLSPFPVVRLVGRVMATGVRVRLLSVRAPICSRVTVRCRGRGCPRRRLTKLSGGRSVRFGALRGRNLAEGVILEVFVRKRDRIGKYTRFLIRAGRPPARRDRCLRFKGDRGTRCPES